MISLREKENLIKTVNNKIAKEKEKNPEDLSEKARHGYCVVTGIFYEKSLKEISSFYSVPFDQVQYWMKELSIDIEVRESKPKKKKNNIFTWLKENVDKETTAKEIAENCGISLPTVYGFINSNIGWFKKVRRGTYIIVDAEKERLEAKRSESK